MDWKKWRLKEWNDCLVQAYFCPDDESGETIRQFDASSSFLAKKLGITAGDGDEAQAFFIAKFQINRNELRKLFDAGRAAQGWTKESENLPFFAQLYLSLIVASATEKTQAEGNFRERLSRLLDKDVPQTLVNCLPRLWEAAREWSVTRAGSNFNYRILVLPDPKHETIIGYSKLLAFPGYKDQTRLAEILTDKDLSSTSPINQLVRAVGRNRNQFSAVFREEFDDFVRDRDSDPNNARSSEMPFWRAVESVTWQSSSALSREGGHALRLELSLTSDEDVFVQAAANKSYVQTLINNWQISNSVDHDDCYTSYIEYGVNQVDNQAAIAAILEDQSAELLGPIRRKSLARQINQGCVVFAREDAFTWCSTDAMPAVGEVCLLLRSGLARKAVEELQRIGGRSPRKRGIADVSGWSCIGPMAASLATAITGLFQFRDLLALQPTISTSDIRLIDGLRLPDGLLFLRPAMPTVQAAGSDFVDCVTAAASVGRLVRNSSGEQVEYQFSPSNIDAIPLPTQLRLTAYADNKVIRTKSVNLVGRCSINKYKIPSNVRHWLREGEAGQLVRWGASSADMHGNGILSAEAVNRISRRIAKRPKNSYSSPNLARAKWVPIDEIPQIWADLFECIAALMTQKSGVGWAEINELINRGLDVSNDRNSSAYVESLIQNGFIQRVYNSRWRGVRLLGVQPEQHVYDGPDVNEKRIVGILSSYQRDSLLQFASERSVRVEVAQSFQPQIFGVTRVVGDDLDGLEQAIDINGANCNHMRGGTKCFPSPADVLTQSSVRSAARTTNPESRWWDTSKKAFCLDERPESNRYALCFQPFNNQISSYSLFDSERLIWQTEDRSWAVFIMDCLATQSHATQLHGKTIVSENPMPLCLANLVIQRGAGVVGFEEGEHNRLWFYMLDDIEEIWNWLNEWGLGPRVGAVSSALVSWLNSYGHGNRANAVNRAQTLRRRY